jgi:hypothetical protein
VTISREVLAAAAQFERDRRGESYPQRIYDQPQAAEALCLDYQCWVAIAEWVESDRFRGFYGGAEPERDGAPWISWPQLETAAEKALDTLTARIDRAERENDASAIAELTVRRAKVVCIHRLVQRMRAYIDLLNHEFRKRRELELSNG